MKELFSKMLEFQKLNLSVEKNAKNPFYKSDYITLDNLVSVITPHLNTLWLVLFHYTENREVKTSITDADTGKSIVSSFPLPDTLEPQKVGSAISYGKRYNIGQLLNIRTDVDDDANSTVNDQNLYKKNFTNTMFRSLIDELKNKTWTKWIEETIEYIKSKYILVDDMEGNIRDYFSNDLYKQE